MNDLHKSRSLIWTLFVLFCIIGLCMLGGRTLIPSDEGRYAEMAREMAATGDWITPRLNGLKYFEKPPLQIWMNALTFKAFGLGELQARLWTGLCGLLGIMLTALAGRRVFGARIGFAAGLVLASSFFWAALGQINTLDMGLSGMMTLTLSALLIAQRDDATARERRNWMMACWAGMGLAVLSKGLIGIVLPGAVLVLYTGISRDWAIWKRLHLGMGLLLFFAMTAPWFLLVSIRNPEFPYFFFIHEHFQRFTSKVHHRVGPWYYFIPVLMLGVLPWLGVLVQSLWAAGKKEPAGFQPKKMLLIWAGFIFVFFSISGSKLPSYILPIFPALALLIAIYLENASRVAIAATAGLMGVLGVAGLALASRIPQLTDEPLEAANFQAAEPWAIAAAVLLLAGAVVVLWWAKQKRDNLSQLATLVLAISGFVAGQLLIAGTEMHGRSRAGVALVPAIQAELTPDMKLYAVGMYDQTLPFYLRRTTILVEHPDEMDFGVAQEPRLWIPTMAQWMDVWARGPKAIALTRSEIYDELAKNPAVHMRVIGRDAKRVVITNDVHQ